MKLAGRPASSNIEKETRPPRDLLDWLLEAPVYAASNWRNRLFPADVGLPRIDFSPAKIQAGIDRDYAQRVALTNRDIIREAARNDIIPISKGDNFYLLGPDRKAVEGYDSPFFQQSLARAANGDVPPDLKTWHYVTSAAKARKVEPAAVGSAAMRFTSSIPSDVIDTLIAEAGSDPKGLEAVAHVINNRAQQWGMTPEQVVKQKGQFEGYSNPGPKSREAQKLPKVRAAAEKAWNAVQAGTIPDPTNGGTSFRAKGTKQPAPNGTVQIGGNVFALGSGASNSALSAINAVAPTPMPSRPVALSYAQNTGTPAPKPRSYAPPGMKSLIEGNAAFGVLPFYKSPDPSTYAPGLGIDLTARDLNPPIVPRLPPARGVGTSYLAPATKVQTYKIDANGNPIVAGTKSALQAATEAKAARIASGAEQFTPTTLPKAAVVRSPSGGWVPAVTQGTQAAGTVQLPAGVRPKAVDDAFRQIETARAAPPVAPVPRAKPLFPVTSNLYAAAPAPVPAPLPSDPRLPKGDPALENFQRGQDIASALYPKPATPSAVSAINAATLPRLPMMPSPAMSAARSAPPAMFVGADGRTYVKETTPDPLLPNGTIYRTQLPTVPVPVRRAPIAPARTPLPQTRTVNPMTQIVPAVQARAGQGLLGGLLNMLTAGNVPQANTQQRAQQNYPTPIPGQTGVEINGVDLAFMPKSVQQSSRWRTGY